MGLRRIGEAKVQVSSVVGIVERPASSEVSLHAPANGDLLIHWSKHPGDPVIEVPKEREAGYGISTYLIRARGSITVATMRFYSHSCPGS